MIKTFFLLATLLVISSCGGDDPAPKVTNTDLLTGSAWTLKSVGGKDPLRIDVLKFKSDGTTTITAPNVSASGVWEWMNSEKSLKITYTSTSSGPQIATLTNLTATELRMTWDYDAGKESLYTASTK